MSGSKLCRSNLVRYSAIPQVTIPTPHHRGPSCIEVGHHQDFSVLPHCHVGNQSANLRDTAERTYPLYIVREHINIATEIVDLHIKRI